MSDQDDYLGHAYSKGEWQPPYNVLTDPTMELSHYEDDQPVFRKRVAPVVVVRLAS